MKAKTTSRVRYAEGDWFQIPMPQGVAVGLVARKAGRGGLGYFFLLDKVLSRLDLSLLAAKDADLVADFGDLGIVDGTWPLLGPHLNWNRAAWPIPQFAHKDALSGKWYLRSYGEQMGVYTKQEPTTAAKAARHPQDGTWGAQAVQDELSERWAQRMSHSAARPSPNAAVPPRKTRSAA